MTFPIVSIRCQQIGKKVDPRTIRRRAEKALVFLERPTAALSILLCNDDFIQQLNREYRGKDSPTDVLSFAMNEGEALQGETDLLGDIIISVQTAERQAPQLDHSLTDEVTSLLVHGLLHLVGYDHMLPEEEKQMLGMSRMVEAHIRSAGRRRLGPDR